MNTNSTKPARPSRDDFSVIRQIRQGLQRYFEMVPTNRPTLPEVWLAKTRLRSWPVASLAVAGGLYLLFLILGAMDGTLAQVIRAYAWRDSLIFSIMIAYLLLIMPVLRRLLNNAIDAFLPLTPATKQRQQMVDRAYSLRRSQEWVAVGLALLIGWGLDPPWNTSPDRFYLASFIYRLIGGGLVFGLTGWHIYSALIRTRVLASLHSQAEKINIFKQNAPTTPILIWSLGVIGALIGGIIVSSVFIDPEDVQSISVVVTYSAIVLAAALVLVFSRVPASLLSQVGMFRALFLFTVVAAIGTFGFIYLEEWTVEQALYTTVITMTTVGYGDLTPSHSASRYFAIGLSLVAVGIAGYAVSSVAAFIVEGNLGRLLRGRKVYKLIGKLNNHIIVCGAGRVGKQIAIELYKTQTPFVMVEQDPAVLDELLQEVEIPFIEGNAMQDQVLTLAGIQRARGLVTALHDDKDNAFVVLSARELAKKLNNPGLRIISRVDNEKQRRKLQQAGADLTISPKAVGGRRMAGMMLYPQIYIFMDEMVQAEQQTGQTLRLEDVHVQKINHPSLIEKLEQDELTVAAIGQHTGLLVVAIKRKNDNQDDRYIYTPRGHTRLEPADILIVLGTPEERAMLRDEDLPGGFEILWSRAEEIWDKWEQRFIREDEL